MSGLERPAGPYLRFARMRWNRIAASRLNRRGAASRIGHAI
jgi:hypothetical protein